MKWSVKWAIGRSGDLLTLWKSGSFVLISSFFGEGFLSIHVSWRGRCVYLVNVYASCLLSKKRELWNRLRLLKDSFVPGYWCTGGDFNAVKKDSERKVVSNQINMVDMEEFDEFIQSMELMHISLLGNELAWFNLYGSVCSTLDKCFGF